MEEESVLKIRIKFRKYGVMKFIGHLDLMRFFQKVMRMADIAICYTEGFSPHQVMSFAAPLGVGVTSDGEYLDIEVHKTAASADAIQALNAVMPDGMEITGYVRLDDHAKTGMSIVCAADYEIWFKEESGIPDKIRDMERLKTDLSDFYEKPQEILVTKKTKKSEKVLDLKKLVYDFQVHSAKDSLNSPVFSLFVCTGSTDNMKPELVMETFFSHIGLVYDPLAVQIHRRDVYYKDPDGSFRTLLEAGEEIQERQ